jgi:cytochrome o ubiquinol oxidase subunit 1
LARLFEPVLVPSTLLHANIWWAAGLGALGAFATFAIFAWRDTAEYRIPAEAVARIDAAHRTARSCQFAEAGQPS